MLNQKNEHSVQNDVGQMDNTLGDVFNNYKENVIATDAATKHKQEAAIIKGFLEEIKISDFIRSREIVTEMVNLMYKGKTLERQLRYIDQKNNHNEISIYGWNLLMNKLELHDKKMKQLQDDLF